MADPKTDTPALRAMGRPEPEREQPVAPHVAGKPAGERQDGPGAGPARGDRDDALPPGATAAKRRTGESQGQPKEPDAGHRGQPAGLTTGAATGSGSGAGGGGTGETEEPDPDSKGGGGRGPGFAQRRTSSGAGKD